MNKQVHNERLEQLSALVTMITDCERYLAADYKMLDSEDYKWLLKLRQPKLLHRIEIRTMAISRLKKYYAKKLFELASMSYNEGQSLKAA